MVAYSGHLWVSYQSWLSAQAGHMGLQVIFFYYFLESWNSGLSLFTPLILSFLLNWLLLILMGTPAPTLSPYYPSSLLCSASFVFLLGLDLMVQFAQVPHRCLHISHPVGLSPFPHVAATSGYFSLNPLSCHSQVPRTDRGS